MGMPPELIRTSNRLSRGLWATTTEPRVSSGQNPIQGLQGQSPLTRLVTVTLQAMLLKDRQDVGFETGRRRILGRQGQDPYSHQPKDEPSLSQSGAGRPGDPASLPPSHVPPCFLHDEIL